jgi:ribosomal protein L4
VLREHDANVELSARNLPNVEVVLVGTQEAAEGRKVGPPGLSTYEVIRAETLVFTQDAVAELEKLEERYAA